MEREKTGYSEEGGVGMAESAAAPSSRMPGGLQPLGTLTIPGKPGRKQEGSSTMEGPRETLPSPYSLPLGEMRVPPDSVRDRRQPDAHGAGMNDGDGDLEGREQPDMQTDPGGRRGYLGGGSTDSKSKGNEGGVATNVGGGMGERDGLGGPSRMRR